MRLSIYVHYTSCTYASSSFLKIQLLFSLQIVHRLPDDLNGYIPHKEFSEPNFQPLPKEVALHVYGVDKAGSQRSSQRGEDDEDGKAEKCGIFSGIIYFSVYVMQCFSECMQTRCFTCVCVCVCCVCFFFFTFTMVTESGKVHTCIFDKYSLAERKDYVSYGNRRNEQRKRADSDARMK